MKRLTILTLSTAMLIACGESTPTTDKGEEDNPLVDGKSDSFFSPTEHGELRMGIANPARITDDEQFHAWNFELSGDATIDLRTEVTTLDTVMYLYHRSSPDDSWGRFKRKNDDDRDAISSRIVHEASAGEWRVIVKGFKSKLRGGFSCTANASGRDARPPRGCVSPTSSSLFRLPHSGPPDAPSTSPESSIVRPSRSRAVESG